MAEQASEGVPARLPCTHALVWHPVATALCQPANSSALMQHYRWMESGEWKVENGKWGMESGEAALRLHQAAYRATLKV